jgi:hypothetical protein
VKVLKVYGSLYNWLKVQGNGQIEVSPKTYHCLGCVQGSGSGMRTTW